MYKSVFKLQLEQDLAGGEIDPEAEAAAMDSTLDPGTNAKDLGAAPGASAEVVAAVAKNNQSMQQALADWISTLEEFVEFLNGTETNSVQSQLKNAVPDTILDKIRSSEMKKISRVSMEVAGLKEIFRGYLASSDDAKYRFV